jgi:hypothetical protein
MLWGVVIGALIALSGVVVGMAISRIHEQADEDE